MAVGKSFRKIAVEEHWGNRELAEMRMADDAVRSVERTPLNEEEKEKIYWGNAANLLGIS